MTSIEIPILVAFPIEVDGKIMSGKIAMCTHSPIPNPKVKVEGHDFYPTQVHLDDEKMRFVLKPSDGSWTKRNLNKLSWNWEEDVTNELQQRERVSCGWIVVLFSLLVLFVLHLLNV